MSLKSVSFSLGYYMSEKNHLFSSDSYLLAEAGRFRHQWGGEGDYDHPGRWVTPVPPAETLPRHRHRAAL